MEDLKRSSQFEDSSNRQWHDSLKLYKKTEKLLQIRVPTGYSMTISPLRPFAQLLRVLAAILTLVIAFWTKASFAKYVSWLFARHLQNFPFLPKFLKLFAPHESLPRTASIDVPDVKIANF